LQGYRSREEALAGVRGRVRFDEQLRVRYGLAPPVEVRYNDFTDDIDPNRLLKAAIHRLGQLRIRARPSRRALHAFDLALANVGLVPYDRHRLPDVVYTHLNAHYRPAVELAKLILRATGFEARYGPVPATAFLVDMNDVFQRFVIVGL